MIPLPVVPLTFQVTVCVLLPAQVTAVFGAVTAKAPPALTTVTITLESGCMMPPPPVRLSRAVSLNFNVRA